MSPLPPTLAYPGFNASAILFSLSTLDTSNTTALLTNDSLTATSSGTPSTSSPPSFHPTAEFYGSLAALLPILAFPFLASPLGFRAAGVLILSSIMNLVLHTGNIIVGTPFQPWVFPLVLYTLDLGLLRFSILCGDGDNNNNNNNNGSTSSSANDVENNNNSQNNLEDSNTTSNQPPPPDQLPPHNTTTTPLENSNFELFLSHTFPHLLAFYALSVCWLGYMDDFLTDSKISVAGLATATGMIYIFLVVDITVGPMAATLTRQLADVTPPTPGEGGAITRRYLDGDGGHDVCGQVLACCVLMGTVGLVLAWMQASAVYT